MHGLEYSSNTSSNTSNNPKRRRTALKSTFRARNGGADTSFIQNTPGLTDTGALGSDTEEEDNEDLAQEYLNRMTDDTDRPTQTVFGKGVYVWKGQDGTVNADLTDEMKKKQRDEQVWGKKRKRGGNSKPHPRQKQRPESIQEDPASHPDPSSTKEARGYADSTIAYPTLPTAYPSFIPPSPTASEWELFPVQASFTQSMLDPATLSPPLEYRPLQNGDRPIKPLPARARGLPTPSTSFSSQGAGTIRSPSSHVTMQGLQRTEGLQPAPSPEHPATHQDTHRLPSAFPRPSQPTTSEAPPTGGFFSNMFGAARRIVSDSFGGIGSTSTVDRFDERPYQLGQANDGGQKKESDGDGAAPHIMSDSFGGIGSTSTVDRFDERPYRLGQAGDGGQKKGNGGSDGGGKGKLDPFKGRPWLRRG
jgi:hypothetical protein